MTKYLAVVLMVVFLTVLAGSAGAASAPAGGSCLQLGQGPGSTPEPTIVALLYAAAALLALRRQEPGR